MSEIRLISVSFANIITIYEISKENSKKIHFTCNFFGFLYKTCLKIQLSTANYLTQKRCHSPWRAASSLCFHLA